MTPIKAWRGVMLTAGLELGLDGLAGIASAAMERELTVLREDPDLRESARRSVAANVALLLTVVQDTVPLQELEPPPAAVAFARELARRHVPVAELGRAYRLAQHALWRWAVDEIHARIASDAEIAEAVEELSDAAFATGDVFSTLVMERYAAERERWVRSAEAVRSATVVELLAGGLVDVTVASNRLGYELRQEHQAFVVWAQGDDAVPETVAVAVGGPRALVVPTGSGIVSGWAPVGTVDPAAVARAGGTRVALASPGAGLPGFRRGHHEAMEARRVARLAGRPADVVAYRDVALLALLTKDPEQARTFVHATLGPLAGGEDTSRRLAQTLHVLLQEQGSPRRAGHRLGVHENTVAKRQRAIDRLLDPATRAPVAELLTALTLLEVVAAEPA
ncbi:MAG: hypothetical protein JWN65_1694 [Solirubrobacterales bacterium]|nr:hypothetical protein [Solirubrobacterales bacterium]